jgi:hypothetical protein
MKFYIVIVFLFVVAGTVQAAQMPSAPAQGLAVPSPLGTPGGVQIAERLFTAAVIEPNGFIAVCFATNLDSVARDLAAQIINSAGTDVTESSSCGAGQKSGVTCDAMAHFRDNSPLRCVVGTSGRATSLRGAMTTSSGPFPFLSPANLTVTAQ